MAASIPHPHGLFSGRRAAQLGATWATLHRDDAPAIHLRTVLLLVALSLGSAAAALVAAHLLTASAHQHAGVPAVVSPVDALAAEAALAPGTASAIPAPLTSLQAALQEQLPAAVPVATPAGMPAVAPAVAGFTSVQPAASTPAPAPAPPMSRPGTDAGAAGPAQPDQAAPLARPEPLLDPSALLEPARMAPAMALAAMPMAAGAMATSLTAPAAASAPTQALPATVTVLAKVTGYCPCALCCGALAEGVTSINRNVYRHPRGIAVDPRLLAYRTYLSVPGYGTAMVDDTGAAMRSDGDHGVIHLDVRFKTHEEALRWGVRWLPIEVPLASQAARLPAADETPAQ